LGVGQVLTMSLLWLVVSDIGDSWRGECVVSSIFTELSMCYTVASDEC
jgi:hypothetical protein